MKEIIGNFVLFCSGANRQILDEQECETDRAKYKMIGGFILLTAVFATLSCGYALYTGFKSVWLAAAIGMLWGLFIFNLDRYIISTMRKKEIDPDMPVFNKMLLRSGEVMSALPRLIFAVCISIVISAPLELKYFDPEIQSHISRTNFEDAKDVEKQVDEEFPQIRSLEEQIKKLEGDIQLKQSTCDNLRQQSFGEADGVSGTGIVGRGPVFREKQLEFEQCKKDLAELKTNTQAKINQKTKERDQWKEKRDKKAEYLKNEKEKGNGFLARLTALHELSEGPGPVGTATLFISLLFILMETTPIVMKLISKRGPYDHCLDVSEYEVYIYSEKAKSDLNEKINNEIAYNTWKNNLILTAEQQLIQVAITGIDVTAPDAIKDAQSDVAAGFICNWKDKNFAQGNGLKTPQAQPTTP
jgi:hypothetical protein